MKKPRCFITVKGLEECTIPVALGSHYYLSYSGGDKAELCKVVNMEEVKLPKKCIIFGLRNVQHVGGEQKGNHGFRYYLHLITEDVNFENVLTLPSVDYTQHEGRNNQDAFLGDFDPLYMSDKKRVPMIVCLRTQFQ